MKIEDYKKLTNKTKKNKFNAKRTRDYDSTGEGKRYQELLLLEKTGRIYNLRRQPKFELWLGETPDRFTVCSYVADFAYNETGRGYVVEDFKGKPEPLFLLKAKMFFWLYCNSQCFFRISRRNGVVIDIVDIKQLTEKGIAPEITAWRRRKREKNGRKQ